MVSGTHNLADFHQTCRAESHHTIIWCYDNKSTICCGTTPISSTEKTTVSSVQRPTQSFSGGRSEAAKALKVGEVQLLPPS